MNSIKTMILSVSNMTCINCENMIELELGKAEGILSVEASYAKGKVKIIYEEAFVLPEEIITLLEQHDYQVRIWDQNERVHENSNSKEPAIRKDLQSTGTENANTGKLINLGAIAIIFFAAYLLAERLGLFHIIRNFPVAKESMGYGMLFFIGILTSVHCVAMCGGICLSQTVSEKSGIYEKVSRFRILRPSLYYNLGRVISYTLIGGIVGALGSVISFSGPMKGMVQLLAGIFMVIMGLNMLNIFPWLRRLNPRMPKLFADKLYPLRSHGKSPLYIGLLNGLMPCGPLQAMQLYALSTGSPIRGAISMFLFSIGTVPLLFLFGALGSLLKKKYTKKMMTVSAVLVVFLGAFMFQNGLGLFGFMIPSNSVLAGQTEMKEANRARIENGIQTVTMRLKSGSYEPIVVQKGVPVKWVIQAQEGDINGCNNSMIIPKYNLQKELSVGDNIIEFTPEESSTIPYSCWMGMIRSKIVVVDDLNSVDSKTITDNISDSNTPQASSQNYDLNSSSCCQ